MYFKFMHTYLFITFIISFVSEINDHIKILFNINSFIKDDSHSHVAGYLVSQTGSH